MAKVLNANQRAAIDKLETVGANGILDENTAGDGIDYSGGVLSLKTPSANEMGGFKPGNGLGVGNDGKANVKINPANSGLDFGSDGRLLIKKGHGISVDINGINVAILSPLLWDSITNSICLRIGDGLQIGESSEITLKIGSGLKIDENKCLVSDTAIRFTNVSVPVSAWVDWPTYADYPYRANITCAGITSSMVASVVFGLTEAVSGKFAPVCATGAGVVTIYASEIPDSAITIPTIEVIK